MQTSYLKNKNIPWILSGFVAMLVGIFFRLYPILIYPHYAAKNTAQLIIYSKVKKETEKKVARLYPHVSPSRKVELMQETLRNDIAHNKKEVQNLIRTTLKKIMSNPYHSQLPYYLMEVDPYYYLSLTENILATGHISMHVKGRSYFNEKMLAPNGAWYPLEYHPYVGYFVFKCLSLFQKDLPLPLAVRWVPLVLACLCILPFLLICQKNFSLSVLPSLLGLLYLLLAPAFLKRSLLGWYDTDPYQILFPLIISFCLFMAIHPESSFFSKMRWAFSASLFMALYTFFWRGWVLMYAFIGISLLISMTLLSLKKINPLQKLKLPLVVGLYLTMPLVVVGFSTKIQGLQDVVTEGIGFAADFFHPSFNLWPDVFISVGELRPSSFPNMLKLLGGWVFYFVALFGTAFTLWQEWRKKHSVHLFPITFLLISFLLYSILASSIERFALLMVMPTALGIAVGVHRLRVIERYGLILTLVGMLLFQAHQAVFAQHPIYNSSWDKVMTRLRNDTPSDSIVTSWWAPGHFIHAMAKRRVTFDGATQNTPQAYWVAHLFLEPSERKALSILRMLNLSGNRAAEFLARQHVALSDAVQLIRMITSLQRLDAKNVLKKIFSETDAETLLNLTHGSTPLPPSYLFVYNDMVKQALALEYIGQWNFKKAEQFAETVQNQNESHPVSRNILKRGSKENVALLWSLSSKPLVQDDEAYESSRLNSTLFFTNGVSLNLDTLEATISSKQFGNGKPKSIFYMENNVLTEKNLPSATLNISVLLIADSPKTPQQGSPSYRIVLADERLIQSLLFRLFYLKGEGLSFLKLFTSVDNVADRTRLFVYEVNWQSFEK